LERTLRDLHRAGVTELISVRRLEEDGTRALIAASFDEELSEEFVRFVHRQAEGNPFFTHEILHALVERGDVYRRNDQWKWSEIDEAEVPESVRSVIGERLSRLQPATQEMLGEASILGQTFHFDELQALGTYAEEDVEGALDEAMHRGIVRETKTDHYVFNHALIQGVLYAELSSRRKRRLHLAAAEALESLPEQRRQGREAELAWHFVEGDDRERALRYSLLAGNRAEDVFAHHEATQHYRAARDLARELEDTTLLCEAWRKLGAVLHLTGRYDAALGALKEALQLARQAHDIDGEIEVVIHLLRYAPERGRHGDVLPWIESILPRLEDDATSPRKLAFFNAYAYFLVQSLQFEEGLQMAEKAVAMAATLGDEHALARAKVSLGHLLLWHGRAAEAEGVLKPAAEYLEQVGDLPEAMRAASLLAQISWFAGDQPAATAWRERSLWLAHQVGNAAQAVYETCMLGYQHLRLGDMEVAWEVGRRALAEAQKMDQSTMTGSPLGLLATLSLTQGKWDDLDRFACEMISLSDHSDEPWWRRHGERTLALRDLLDERADRALARLEPLLLGTELDMQEQALYLPVLAEAYLQAGNLHQARQVLDTSLALHGRAMRGMLAETLCVHAKLLLANGELAGAETVLNDLLDLTRSLPYPFVEAQALVACGQLEAMRGSPGAARQRLEEALTIFQRLAAQPFVEQTERVLAQLAPGTASEV
jgi:tetratricopeptide (TPR) repeat protein